MNRMLNVVTVSPLLLALLLATGCASSKVSTQTSDPAYPVVTIFDAESQQQFSISAVVIELYKCPPCPPGAECKPCIGDHIVIADRQGNRLRVFSDSPERFQVGKTYRFYLKRRVAPRDEAVLIKFEE